jgi:hypothetical protein
VPTARCRISQTEISFFTFQLVTVTVSSSESVVRVPSHIWRFSRRREIGRRLWVGDRGLLPSSSTLPFPATPPRASCDFRDAPLDQNPVAPHVINHTTGLYG